MIGVCNKMISRYQHFGVGSKRGGKHRVKAVYVEALDVAAVNRAAVSVNGVYSFTASAAICGHLRARLSLSCT